MLYTKTFQQYIMLLVLVSVPIVCFGKEPV